MHFLSVPRLAIAVLAIVLFAGCSTINPQDQQVLRDHRIPAPLYEKMMEREPLALSEIAQLSTRHVPPEFIIRYIDSSFAEYQLTTDDVLLLQAIGVSHEVIDFLLTTGPRPTVVANRYPYTPLYYTRTLIIRHHHRRR